MSDVHILAIGLAKRSFQVCGTDRGAAVLGEQLDGGNIARRRIRQDRKSIAGTKLIRGW